jgi:PAS domain-containing protein
LASDWYWEQDEAGAYTRMSGPVLDMLGIQVEPFLAGEARGQTVGWNEPERKALLSMIAERQPFLDFRVSRVDPDGTLHQFQVSGEPMFSQACRFIGYRGIGVELTRTN